MSYKLWRAAAIRSGYARTIQNLVKRYRRDRPTIVLLPGGMGSQLDRSRDKYNGSIALPQFFKTVWADSGIILLRDALKLEIDGQGRDIGKRAIIPNGPLEFIVKAYDGTEEFFSDLGWNFVTFGYDWRRPLDEGAAYLEDFLIQLRDAIRDRHGEDPLPQSTLLAHSQGGLVLKIFLHRIVGTQAWFDKAITVGTPFYGTSTHQERYFVGDPLLNRLYDPSDVVRVVSSVPGPYSLMFLPKTIFDRDGAAMGLTTYPITDPGSDQPMDPYDRDNLRRYPKSVDDDHLEQARRLYDTISAPLPDGIRTRFFNLRTCLEANTATSISWKPLPDDFRPTDPSPVFPDGTDGGGDGTVPCWSAWHITTPPDNKVALTKAKKHQDLMEHSESLEAIRAIVESTRPATSMAAAPDNLYGDATNAVPREEVEALLDDVMRSVADQTDPRMDDPRIWRRLLRELQK